MDREDVCVCVCVCVMCVCIYVSVWDCPPSLIKFSYPAPVNSSKLNSILEPFERYDPWLIGFEIFNVLPQRFAQTTYSVDIGRIVVS